MPLVPSLIFSFRLAPSDPKKTEQDIDGILGKSKSKSKFIEICKLLAQKYGQVFIFICQWSLDSTFLLIQFVGFCLNVRACVPTRTGTKCVSMLVLFAIVPWLLCSTRLRPQPRGNTMIRIPWNWWKMSRRKLRVRVGRRRMNSKRTRRTRARRHQLARFDEAHEWCSPCLQKMPVQLLEKN